MLVLEFADKRVSYEEFVEDLSTMVARKLAVAKADPETISQRQAYRIFGRSNVERWLREGRVDCYKRPGKVEYRTADLRKLQQVRQDYFIRPTKNY